MWICSACEYENEEEDLQCAACDEARPVNAEGPDADEDPYKNICVGKIVECREAPNASQLRLLKVDVGAASPLDIVTNASNVKVDMLTVVAMVGAVVKDEEVKKTSIKGFPSAGMLCDCPMLGWTGGGAGAAIVLAPGSFVPGARPPSERPRGGPAA